MKFAVAFGLFVAITRFGYGNAQCSPVPTVARGTVECDDTAADATEVVDTKVCRATCDDGQTANPATATCETNAFSAVLACPAVCVTNCMTCASTTDCTTCESGYRLEGVTTCTACAIVLCATCTTTDNAEQCLTCNTGYELDDGACRRSCDDDHCVLCTNAADTCLQCSEGYRLDNVACQECTVTNCATCPDAADTCATCKTGYEISDSNTCEATGDDSGTSNLIGSKVVTIFSFSFSLLGLLKM